MMDFIQGDKFIKMADYTYAPMQKSKSAYDGLQNTLNLSMVKDGDIVYTHGFYIYDLLDLIRDFDKKILLVTHNSDTNIDDSFVIPECVSKWYAQNVNTMNPKIHSIPIGLENDRWFPHIRKKEKMMAKLKEPRKYRNLVYMNHNIRNNPAKRQKPYDILRDKSWVTAQMGKNGEGFDEYLDNIYNHKFVVCPEGNGIDTHRVWECLYMGSIPIVEDNITAELLYSYLPCLIAHDGWEGLDDVSLDWEFYLLNKIKETTDIHNEMLTFNYWKNKIYGI